MQSRRKSLTKRQHVPDETEQLEALELLKKSARSRSMLSSPTNRSSMMMTVIDESGQPTQKSFELPLIPVRKVLAKIGGLPKQQYSPTAEEYQRVHEAKAKELKQLFYGKPKKTRPYNHQIDEIVLGCYQYNKQMGWDTVWRWYKNNFDELSYDTIRVMMGKRRL